MLLREILKDSGLPVSEPKGDMSFAACNGFAYLCDCCHEPRCHPYCITASEIIATRFDTYEEAERKCLELEEMRYGKWAVALIPKEPQTIVMDLRA